MPRTTPPPPTPPHPADSTPVERPPSPVVSAPAARPEVVYENPPTTLREYCDQNKVLFLANQSFEQMQAVLTGTREEQKAKYTMYKRILIKHAESEGDGFQPQPYKFSDNKTFGRMYSPDGIMKFSRSIRGFICTRDSTQDGEVVHTPLMTDIDMSNCHPTILRWLCVKHGFECRQLSRFVDDRETCYADMEDKTGKTRDEVKQMFLSIVNSDRAWEGPCTEFFGQLDTECKRLQVAFMNLVDYRHIHPHAEKSANQHYEERARELRKQRRTTSRLTKNVPGCFLNLVLCTWENRMLGTACTTLAERGIDVCANCYDGLLLKGNQYEDPSICTALQAALFSKYGIDMKWSYKAHSSDFALVPNADNEQTIKIPYKVHKRAFLQRIFRVGHHYVYREQDGTERILSGENVAERLRGEELKVLVLEGSKQLAFAKELLRDPEMKNYDAIGFYPEPKDCPPNHYNVCTPMPFKSVPEGAGDLESENVQLLKTLLWELSGQDQNVLQFMNEWIAHMMVYPGTKPNAYLILMSAEGAGKGTLVHILQALFGKKLVKDVNNAQRSIFGNHNGLLMDAFFVCLDEADGKALFEGKEELKNLITANTTVINQKSKDQVTVPSYTRWMITMQPRRVPTQAGDRRTVISRCSDSLKGNSAFFERMYACMETPEFLEDVTAHFRQFSPPKVFNELPTTEVIQSLQACNADPFDQWLAYFCESFFDCTQCLCKVEDCSNPIDYENLTARFKPFDLYNNYCVFCQDHGMGHLTDRCSLRTFLFYFDTNANRECFGKARTMTGRYRVFDMRGLAKNLDIVIEDTKYMKLVVEKLEASQASAASSAASSAAP